MENKKVRNIEIGLLQNRVPALKDYLKVMVENVMDYYITINGLTIDDIIVRQKDGIVVSKQMKEHTKSLNLEFREHILKCIITTDRRKYLKINSEGKVECLGVPNKPMNLSFLEMFRNLNFSNKKKLAMGLEIMRQTILKSSNKQWFVRNKDDTHVIVPLIGGEQLILSKLNLTQIESDEIDRELTWNSIVWPFVESIMLYC